MSHETDGVDSPSNLQAEEEALSKVENALQIPSGVIA